MKNYDRTLAADDEKLNPSQDETSLIERMKKVFVEDGNHAMAFISDNPDGSARVALLRGDHDTPELYDYLLTNGILSPSIKKPVLRALKQDDDYIKTDNGIYDYMATVVGAANCTTMPVSGVKLMRAMYGPMPDLLASFTSVRKVNDVETVFLKRSRNIARNHRNIVNKLNEQTQNTEQTPLFDEEFSLID